VQEAELAERMGNVHLSLYLSLGRLLAKANSNSFDMDFKSIMMDTLMESPETVTKTKTKTSRIKPSSPRSDDITSTNLNNQTTASTTINVIQPIDASVTLFPNQSSETLIHRVPQLLPEPCAMETTSHD